MTRDGADAGPGSTGVPDDDRSGSDGAPPDDGRAEPDGGHVRRGVAPATDVAGAGVLRDRARQVLAVAAQEYRLSVRNRWAYALVGVFALLAGPLAAFGTSRVGPAGHEAVVVSLASLATYLVPLAALAFGYDAVVGAAEDGWLDVVFALPVPRAAVVWGTYLGRAVALAAATAVGFGLAGAVLLASRGPGGAGLYAGFLLSAVGVGLAFLALSVLVSTVAAEKTHALGAALVVWVWFVLLHDLLALGVLAAVEVPDAAVAAMVVTNPADVFRLLVLRGVETTGGGAAAVFAGSGLSTPALAVALVAWCLVPVAVAGRLVKRRSL